jgi:CHAT domain-containing protein
MIPRQIRRISICVIPEVTSVSGAGLRHAGGGVDAMNKKSTWRLCRRLRLPIFLLLLSIAWLPSLVTEPAFAATPEELAAGAAEQLAKGGAEFRTGNFERALEASQRASVIYETAGNREGQIKAFVQGAEAQLALGRYPNALEALHRALDLAKKTNSPSLIATVTASIGNAYGLAGRPAEAEQLLKSSIDVAIKANDFAIAASALNNLGNLLAWQHRFAGGADAYERAIEAADKAGDNDIVVRASANLARARLNDGRYNEAARLLAQARDKINALGSTHDRAYALISMGRLYAQLSEVPGPSSGELERQAYKAFTDAVATAESINDQHALSYALGYMGELYEKAKRYDQAQQLTQQAVLAAQRVDAPVALYRWYWQTGRLLNAQGNTEAAITAYQNAVSILRTIRQDLTTGYGGAGVSFRETVGPVYFELADLLLQRSGQISDPAQVKQHLVDARDAVESLKGAELEDYFQDDCVARLRAKTTGIDQLAPQTAAIYPIILPDRTELLLSTPQGLKRFTAKVDADTLTKEVRTFRQLLEKRTTHQYLPHAQKLYGWIIGPLESELARQNIDTLVIVPDGPLRTIPMAALYDGKQFLGARYALATTPGLKLTDPRPIERQNVRIMINGLTESVQGFPALPYVAEEVKNISSMYGGIVLENKDFIVPKMEKALTKKTYSIVHIASHGQFSSNIDKTFILTYDSKLSMNALENFLGLAKFRDEPVELLTLSACQTAAGDDRAALGLAGVAVKAGARSAVATLWTVNDPASALLISEFYRQLENPSVSKAKALQQAQLKLIQDPRYRHPGYWSPFLLIGNWL